jgi:ribonuclease D
VPEAAGDLDTNQRALFNHLREWRMRTSREEGVPPYVLFTNRELASIVRARPDSPTALGTIEGVGPGKVKRFGRGLLAALRGAPRPAPGASAGQVAGATPDTVEPEAGAEVVTNAPQAVPLVPAPDSPTAPAVETEVVSAAGARADLPPQSRQIGRLPRWVRSGWTPGPGLHSVTATNHSIQNAIGRAPQ